MNHSSVYLRKPWALFGVGLSLFAAQTAFSQPTSTTSSDTTKKDDMVSLEKVTVTGSFVPLSGTVQASPVVTIKADDIGASGATDVNHLLKQLTALFSGNGNLGTELNNGGTGESNIALRNLSTLVLLNGQRLINSPNSNGKLVDVNQIPTAMIDRVDVLKDGASTIYGSDAIGGVVNIILRKNYTGFEAGTRFGTDKGGDYRTREGYIMGGVSTDTGSITIAAQHFENTALGTLARPLTTLTPAEINARGFNVTSSVYSGTYPGRVGNDVLAGSTLIATGAPGFKASVTSPGMKSSPNDPAKTLADLEAAGIYIKINTTPAGIAAGGATALNTTLFDNPLIVNTKRDQFVASAEKQLYGKSLEVFSDFLFSDTVNGGAGLAPSPIAGVGPGGGNTLFIPANNPYNVFNVDFPGPLAARTRAIEFGKRSSVNETTMWRLLAGLRGEINDKYSWEATFNYSRASALQRILGGVNGANMNTAMVPLLDDSGNYVFNAAGKPLSMLTDSQGNNLPVYNYFALPGFNDKSTLDALSTTLYQNGVTTLRDIGFILRGAPFELPAGELKFAIGASTYKETIESSVDALFANGLALGYNPASTFAGGARRNKGAFIEFNVPVFSDKQNIPGLHQLDLTPGYRYEKLEPGGNASTPKVGLRWLPFDDQFAIRSTWAKGFIAPSIFDLFGPSAGNSPAYAIWVGDGRSGSGGSLGTMVTGQFGTANELSNPLRKAAHSTSYTFGVVYSPKQVKGLSVTIDYYNIKQDMVGGIDYTAVFADLNAKGSGSVYAGGFLFADNTRLTSTTPNQVTSTNVGSITIANNPAGDQKTDGLDFSVDYTFGTADFGRFSAGVNGTVLFNYRARATPDDPYNQYARVYTDQTNGLSQENGLLPGYLIKPYITNTYKSLSTSIFLNYIPTVIAPGSLFGGQDVVNNDTLDGKVAKIPSYFTADVSVSYTLPNFNHNWARNFVLTVGANNVFNKQPPYVPGDGNGSSENNTVKGAYDIVGRFIFAQIKKSF